MDKDAIEIDKSLIFIIVAIILVVVSFSIGFQMSRSFFYPVVGVKTENGETKVLIEKSDKEHKWYTVKSKGE